MPSSPINAQRAAQFFHTLIASNGTGIVTPTTFNEFAHIAIKLKYNQERLRFVPGRPTHFGRPVNHWLDLYKQDKTILQSFLPELQQLRQLLIANELLFLKPEDLGPIASGRSYDEELIHSVCAYGLDSNDAAILIEAQRFGVPDVISLDTDMQRASVDFNVYTWLS